MDSPNSSKARETMRRRLKRREKRDASRARPHRVGTLRRFFTSCQAAAYAEQARARSGARVATRRYCAVYVTGAYRPVAHAQACARRVRRRRKRCKREDASALRRLALPKLESAHSKIKTRKSKLAKTRVKRRSDQEATSLCSHGPFSIAVSRSAASVN